MKHKVAVFSEEYLKGVVDKSIITILTTLPWHLRQNNKPRSIVFKRRSVGMTVPVDVFEKLKARD